MCGQGRFFGPTAGWSRWALFMEFGNLPAGTRLVEPQVGSRSQRGMWLDRGGLVIASGRPGVKPAANGSTHHFSADAVEGVGEQFAELLVFGLLQWRLIEAEQRER